MSRGSNANDKEIDSGLRLRMRGEERRISSQHKQLEDLFQRVRDTIRRSSPSKGLSDFLLFATALEAHMSVEEDIYFPAFHGLRGDIAPELESLIGDHERLRRRLEEIPATLRDDDSNAVRHALDELAADVGQHEASEEALIARVTEGPSAHLGSTSFDA